MFKFKKKTKTENEAKLSKKEIKAQEKERKKQEKLKKMEEKAHAKRIRKEALEELKKDKEEARNLKRNGFLKFLRGLFWCMIIFIFIKGVIVSLRPDPTVEVNKTIKKFKEEFQDFTQQDNEVLAFAENFAYEYMTYEIKGENDYKERLQQYINPRALSSEIKLIGSSRVLYCESYKIEPYSNYQYDVFVLLEVKYLKKDKTEDGKSIRDVVTKDKTILKVPVAKIDKGYIIEDLPMFVNDDVKTKDYQPTVFKGKEITRDESTIINEALSNFFKAYYEDEQSVINYFLTANADKEKFLGLNSRVKFDKIVSSRNYALDEEGKNILSIATVSVVDQNGVKVQQKYNLELLFKDNQYYIKDLNTRSANLNFSIQEEENNAQNN